MPHSISTPRDFSFKRTVLSHGWAELPPFSVDRDTWILKRVLDLGESPPVTVTINGTRRALLIRTSRPLGQRATKRVERQVRHMLRLDDDLSGFYRTMSTAPDFAWITEQGAGRLLRSPTVFEDLVKMICTTNCSWSLTEKMVKGLVRNLGREASDGGKTFPTPEAMARRPLRFFVNEVRAGYRAAYLKELADQVAAGAIDVEGWLTSDLPAADLLKQMKRIKGVGDYAAENLLKLVGRYDGLALDSWTRSAFGRVRNNGRKASDRKITRYYARFNEWRGLAIWCDLTRDWIAE